MSSARSFFSKSVIFVLSLAFALPALQAQEKKGRS